MKSHLQSLVLEKPEITNSEQFPLAGAIVRLFKSSFMGLAGGICQTEQAEQRVTASTAL